MGSQSGQGLDFISEFPFVRAASSLVHTNATAPIDGFTFLQRFYSVYDTTNSQVGIAPTPNTDAETN